MIKVHWLGFSMAALAFGVVVLLVGCAPAVTPTLSPLASPDIALSPLTTPAPMDSTSVWPAGRVVYHSDMAGLMSFQIYKVVDGGDPVKLSPAGAVDVSPRWSFDGTMLVFASYIDDMRTNQHIFTMAADGSGRTALPVDQPRLNWRPSLSPDGMQVLFISNRDGNFEIYKANLDGSALINLTNTSAYGERDPDWSPDGRQIVFVSDASGGNGLYVMDTDGGNIRQLLDGAWRCSFPNWSPDGEKIAFTARVAGTDHIHIINADGSDVLQVTSRVPDNVMPAWVGNDRLLFSGSDGGEIWNLFMINIDGTGLVQLTDTPYSERYPQWHP